MKIYNEQVTLQSQKPAEVFNITTQVKAAAEKSGVREGMVVVSGPHTDTAILIHPDDPASLGGLIDWLAENAGNAHFHRMLLNHQLVIPLTQGRLDLEPGQSVLFIELGGLRPRRIAVKIIGE